MPTRCGCSSVYKKKNLLLGSTHAESILQLQCTFLTDVTNSMTSSSSVSSGMWWVCDVERAWWSHLHEPGAEWIIAHCWPSAISRHSEFVYIASKVHVVVSSFSTNKTHTHSNSENTMAIVLHRLLFIH